MRVFISPLTPTKQAAIKKPSCCEQNEATFAQIFDTR